MIPSGFPVVSSVAAWCQMLGHQCDGVDGTCTCSCHATNPRAIATLTHTNEGRPSAGMTESRVKRPVRATEAP